MIVIYSTATEMISKMASQAGRYLLFLFLATLLSLPPACQAAITRTARGVTATNAAPYQLSVTIGTTGSSLVAGAVCNLNCNITAVAWGPTPLFLDNVDPGVVTDGKAWIFSAHNLTAQTQTLAFTLSGNCCALVFWAVELNSPNGIISGTQNTAWPSQGGSGTAVITSSNTSSTPVCQPGNGASCAWEGAVGAMNALGATTFTPGFPNASGQSGSQGGLAGGNTLYGFETEELDSSLIAQGLTGTLSNASTWGAALASYADRGPLPASGPVYISSTNGEVDIGGNDCVMHMQPIAGHVVYCGASNPTSGTLSIADDHGGAYTTLQATHCSAFNAVQCIAAFQTVPAASAAYTITVHNTSTGGTACGCIEYSNVQTGAPILNTLLDYSSVSNPSIIGTTTQNQELLLAIFGNNAGGGVMCNGSSGGFTIRQAARVGAPGTGLCMIDNLTSGIGTITAQITGIAVNQTGGTAIFIGNPSISSSPATCGGAGGNSSYAH